MDLVIGSVFIGAIFGLILIKEIKNPISGLIHCIISPFNKEIYNILSINLLSIKNPISGLIHQKSYFRIIYILVPLISHVS